MRNRLIKAVFGIILIFVGLTATLGNFGVIGSADFLWDVLFVLLGGYLFYIGAKKEVLFEGIIASFLITLGGVGLLSEFELIPMGISDLWPCAFLVLGLYIIITFSKNRSKWLLCSGSLFVIIGSLFVLKRFGILIFSFREILFKTWPIVLILLGLYVLKGLIQKKENRIF